MQELYRPGLRQVGRPEAPYPDVIDREKPYPRGFRVPEFTLFRERMVSLRESTLPDSQFNVESWQSMIIFIILS